MDQIADGEIFHLIVTGQYLAVSWDGSTIVLRPDHHRRGDRFSMSLEGKLVHGPNEDEVGTLVPDDTYDEDLFYLCRESKYLGPDAEWIDSTDGALQFQVNSLDEFDAESETQIMSQVSSPIVDESNPVSADGIDLRHPDAWFNLYFFDCGCRDLGDAHEAETEETKPELILTGYPFGSGTPFRLVTRDGKLTIQDAMGRVLGAILKPSLAGYLKQGCRQHDAMSRCGECFGSYGIGLVAEAEYPVTVVPQGLPTTFVLYDGSYYYSVEVLKGGYSELKRVEDIEDASLVEFVGR